MMDRMRKSVAELIEYAEALRSSNDSRNTSKNGMRTVKLMDEMMVTRLYEWREHHKSGIGRIYIKWEDDGVSLALWPKGIELFDAMGAFRGDEGYVITGFDLNSLMDWLWVYDEYDMEEYVHYRVEDYEDYDEFEETVKDMIDREWLDKDVIVTLCLEHGNRIRISGMGEFNGMDEVMNAIDVIYDSRI